MIYKPDCHHSELLIVEFFFSLKFDACQSQAPSILKINGANSKLIGKISSKFKFLFSSSLRRLLSVTQKY